MIVTVLSRKITIVKHSLHILSTGRDQASDALSATYFSGTGSNTVDLDRGEEVEIVLEVSDYSMCHRIMTMWDHRCLSSQLTFSSTRFELEQRHQAFPSNGATALTLVLVNSRNSCRI